MVDDETNIRKLIAKYASFEGYQVEEASNGEAAVGLCRSGAFDLIVMDIMMPVMDGYEAARRIRKLADPVHANKPIIAMTANAFEEDVKAALAAGMNEHLSKPIRIELLYEIMKKYL